MSEPNRPEDEDHQQDPLEPGVGVDPQPAPPPEAAGQDLDGDVPAPPAPRSAWDQQRAGWGEPPAQPQWEDQPTQVQPQQQWGQPQQPWGEQPTQAQPQQQWGQPQWGAAPSASSAQQPQQQWGQQPGYAQQYGPAPQATWGGGYAGPPGQPPSGEEPKKKGLGWLWVTIGGLVVLAVVYLLVAFVMKIPPFQPALQSLVDSCADGSAEACEELFQRAEENSDAEDFGRTCGGRADGYTNCDDVDMTLPINSWNGVNVDPTDPGATTDPTTGPESTDEPNASGEIPLSNEYGDNSYLDRLWDDCEAGNMEQCDRLYWSSEFDTGYEAFAKTCGGTNSDQVGTCSGSDIGPATAVGDDPVLDALAEACNAGDMEACDDLFDVVVMDGEYREIAGSCGYTEPAGYEYYCNPNHTPDLQFN